MKRLSTLIACLFTATMSFGAFRNGVTTLVMNMDISNGIVAPAPASRVRVPPGEMVVLTLPDAWQYTIQWTKNGIPLPGATGRAITLPSASASDSGLYVVTGAPFPTITTGINLDVVPEGHWSNLSARVELGSTGVQVLGFVVSGRIAKTILFRAVGPSLSALGVPNPAPRPIVQCFDAAGHQVGFVHIAVPIDVNALFQSVGAFPVLASELSTLSYDYGSFSPGAYTLHVSDAANHGGTALVEAYEMQ